MRSLFQRDFAFLCQDNPEYASQAGQHNHDARLQDLSPAAFEARGRHCQVTSVMQTIMLWYTTEAAHAQPPLQLMLDEAAQLAEELKNEDRQEVRTALLHLELFRKSVADELEALTLKCHLYPVNSIGAPPSPPPSLDPSLPQSFPPSLFRCLSHCKPSKRLVSACWHTRMYEVCTNTSV